MPTGPEARKYWTTLAERIARPVLANLAQDTIGRSLAYRFGAFQLLAQMALRRPRDQRPALTIRGQVSAQVSSFPLWAPVVGALVSQCVVNADWFDYRLAQLTYEICDHHSRRRRRRAA
jgi:hypothetical protein